MNIVPWGFRRLIPHRREETNLVVRNAHSSASDARGWLFVLPWTLESTGGVSQVVSNLFRHAVADKDCLPHFMVLDWDAVGTIEETSLQGMPAARARLRAPGILLSQIRAHIGFLFLFVPSLFKLWSYLRRNRISVVNIHYPTVESLYFAFIRKCRGLRRLLISVHGKDVNRLADKGPFERMLWRYIFSAADSIVVCSNAFGETLPGSVLGRKDRVVTIHNGIDTAFCEQERQGASSLPPSSPYILSVASFEYKKGLDVLVRAFSRVIQSSNEALRLVIVGRWTAYADELKTLIGELEKGVPALKGRIDLAYDENHAVVLKRMEGARLFVLPSRSEPFGIVLLEAGYLGIPVIATAVGGVPEIIESDCNGLLVPPDDEDSLGSAISRLLNDGVSAQRYAGALKKRVDEQFAWRDAWAKYRKLAGLIDIPAEC